MSHYQDRRCDLAWFLVRYILRAVRSIFNDEKKLSTILSSANSDSFYTLTVRSAP
jgi:hypothetical protein